MLLHVGGGGGPSWLDWAVQPDVLLLCIFLEAAYLYVTLHLRERVSDAGRVRRSQLLAFSLGVLVIFLAAGSPLHDLADERLVSAHMLQHILLMLVAAPLLLAGVPTWVWQALLRLPRAMPAARLLTHPLVALAAFNGVLLLTHLPSVVELQLREWWFHLFVHGVQLAAGVLMWWPVLSSVPELPRLSYPLQMGYLFVQSLLPTVMASFVTFADRVVYSPYAEAPRLWGISPIQDQQIAGLVMKLLGGAILWVFIAIAFFRWYEREEAEARGPRWQEIEAELEQLGLSSRRKG